MFNNCIFLLQTLQKAGCTHSLYATFKNGLAYQFIQGDILTVENVREPNVYWLVAKRMAQMHKLNPNFPDTSKVPIIWDKAEKFMSIMPKEFEDPDKQRRYLKEIEIQHSTVQNIKLAVALEYLRRNFQIIPFFLTFDDFW